MAEERNPLLIPDVPARQARRGCPKCGGSEFNGDNLGGMIQWTCSNKACRNQWYGGLPQMPEDPTVPRPAIDPKDKPLVDYVRSRSSQTGFAEVRNRPSLVPEFRKGLPVGKGEE